MINTPQAPYFDDFNVEKNFLKILFKPKLSVQTRELEQMQSMFQHQVETLASQIFKNGSVVSGGKFTFENSVDYVKLNTEYDGELFKYGIFDGRHLYGLTTHITTRVFNGWSADSNEIATIYVDYLDSGENGESTYQPGEVLQMLSYGYFTVVSGTFQIGDILQGQTSGAMATIVNINNNEYELLYSTPNTFEIGEQVINNSSSGYLLYTSGEGEIYKCQVKAVADDPAPVGKGSAVFVDEGIYYIDGYFVHTDNQSKIISPYTTETNAKIGFEKEIEIITSSEDSSLLDNANGYPNENAPGADRLKINLVLNYYNKFETPSENFVEIMTIDNSVVTGNASTNQQYSEILDTLARRTYDESGNYTVNPFLIDIREFLDENDNNGIYQETHFGYNTQAEALNCSMEVFDLPAPGESHVYGTKYYPYDTHEHFLQACRDRLAIGIETGKAYVMGYEIEHKNKTWHPILKARDINTLTNSGSSVFYGNYIKVKEITGLPDIYHRQTVSLSTDAVFANDNIIGTAQVYAIEMETGNPGEADAVYRLYLDNIKMTSGDFGTDVSSLGAGQAFSAKTVKTNGVNAFYNLDNVPLIFPLEKDVVYGVLNSSYNYKKVFTGQVTSSGSGNGTITLPTDQNARFVDPSDYRNYMLAITSGSEMGTVIDFSTIAVSIDGSGNITFSGLPVETVDASYIVIATLHKQVNTIKTKTLYENVQFISTSGSYREIVLDHADGYRLVGIYDSEDPGEAPTTNSTNVTDNYTFDNGQRDTYYDLARVVLKEGAIEPTGQVLVVYDYFSHSAGDYFTADSYRGQIEYTDIPSYTTGSNEYYLADCIDLRPRVDDNGSGNFTSPALPHIMQNNSTFECDLEYYLPRFDLLELDYRGNFNVKYGTSSDNPQYPVGSINSMTLYYLAMPPYTESPDDVARIYCENKRYTMRDIGGLDSRITAIENYIELTSQELDTSNTPIFDLQGYQCIKTGFIVDMFVDHSYGDTSISGYRCSIDSEAAVLRPDFKLNTINLEKSTDRASTVAEYNGKFMIPYTPTAYLTNTVNTGYIIMNSNQMVDWQGNVILGDKSSNTYSDDISTINYGNAQDDVGSIYNKVVISWLGFKSTF